MRNEPVYRRNCRKFTGYRPCVPGRENCDGCREYVPAEKKILLINLDSMGDVLRSTAVLPAIKRKYPESHITWITLPRSIPLLEANPLIDRILAVDPALPFILESLAFDIAYNVDKGLPSGSMINRVNAQNKIGFGVDENGAIYPLNSEANELYRTGLDDEFKFHVNRKTENQLLAEAFGLEYKKDEYVFSFHGSEKQNITRSRKEMGLGGARVVVGFNTGCSELYPYKRLPLQYQKKLITSLKESRPEWEVILLGGLEDSERNDTLSNELEGLVVNTPTEEGLRRGMIYTDLADVVFTGDSLGMHMAIALKKRMVTWFGLTCDQEIELFGRGEKILARVDCRPCWKKSCSKKVKCYDRVDPQEALEAIIRQGEEVEKEKRA